MLRGAQHDQRATASARAWALAPVAILVLQSVSGIVLEGWEIWMLRLGAASLIFASFVFVLAAIELRRVRTL